MATPRTRRHTGRRQPTLAVIAEAAGVSTATVSKVLNGRPDVAVDTRARVERLLAEHEYVPPAARGPVALRRTVGLILDDLTTAYSAEIIQGVTDAGWEFGVDVVVGRMRNEEHRAAHDKDSWASRLHRAGREGVVVVTSKLTEEQLAEFSRQSLPVVLIDPLNQSHDGAPSVGATNWTGGLSATEHLVELGHRRIGFVGGPPLAACSRAREHGYRAALERVGARSTDDLVVHGNFHYDDGHRLGMELLQRHPDLTAIFAANDETALGVMQAAYSLGRRIPDQLSVVGFDDTSLARWSTPPLTTVRAHLQDMGRVALRTLLQLVSGEPLDSHHVQLVTQLVVRHSTAPASQTGTSS